MPEIPNRENFMDKRGKKSKAIDMPKKGGTLGKNGQVWQNDLLDADYTSQNQIVVRKLH